MTYDEILAVFKDVTGDPSSGPIFEWLPTLAAALDAALNPPTVAEVTAAKE